MSHNKDIKLFFAAYYADLNKLQELIACKSDTQIKVPISKEYCLWETRYVDINVLDILNCAAFGFYEYYTDEEICHKIYDIDYNLVQQDCINPSEYYKKVMSCIIWLCDKFQISNYLLKDYSPYRSLAYSFCGNNCINEKDFNDYISKGFNEIDLNLINEATNGNGIACYELFKKGANYEIDIYDGDESYILFMLGGDLSFNLLQLISFLSLENKNSKLDFFMMLSSLYQVGVFNYILDIVIPEDETIV
jgi:hypothetical protein